MLTHLAIKDLVIIHELSLDLGSGMTAMTGETGAGKSIMVDALNIALGGKADKRVIRSQCSRAEITASFDISSSTAAMAWMREHELDADDDCILHRILVREGRARAYINNRPVPLQQLRALGDLLVDIHGQHEHQSLLRASAQRRLLDVYANNQQLLQQVNDNYRHWQNSQAELDKLQESLTDRNSRLDYISYQLQEVAGVDLSPEHIEALDKDQTRLAHAEQLGSEISTVIEILYEAESAVHPLLSRAHGQIQALSNIDSELQAGISMLDEARIQVEEVVTLLREQGDNISVNPQRLATVEAALGHIHDLARKHHLKPAELSSHFDALQDELQTLEDFDGSLDKLQQQIAKQQARYLSAAKKLSKARVQSAKALSAEVTTSMQNLGLEGGVFEIKITTTQATATGQDHIAFEVAANPGQPQAALARVASGGELSRISLAIQVATAGCVDVPTLVYDEVDVGIGGGVATKVGRLLRELGQNRQVLVVTHLAQVAAHANHHFQVDKQISADTTETRVVALDQKNRVNEIARMLGSEDITDQSLAHAGEMIASAQ